jgi:uncharacterized protein YjlB
VAKPEAFLFADDGAIPNSPLPLLVYRHAVPADAAAIERLFAAHLWPPAWRNGVYPFHHFHALTHEALGVARGHARVRFGGPAGQALAISAGDVVVIPAGLGHCREEAAADLLIVGAYPAGAPPPDLHRGRPGEHAAAQRAIAAVPRPDADPVLGAAGPLVSLWAAAGTKKTT